MLDFRQGAKVRRGGLMPHENDPALTVRAISAVGVEVPMTYALGTSRGRERLEIGTPTGLYARGIAEILLVEGVEKIGVTAVERCGFKHA